MSLDDILQTHAPDLLHGGGHIVHVAIHNIRHRHEGIPRKQDTVFLNKHGDPIRTVSPGRAECQVFLADAQIESTLVEDQMWQDDLGLLEHGILFFYIDQGGYAAFQ